MNIIKGLKKRLEQKKETTFSIQSNEPKLEIGSVHEDNKWFHGTSFKVLSVDEVQHHPDEHWHYTIKGKCQVVTS